MKCEHGCERGMILYSIREDGKRIEGFCSCNAGREASARYAKNWPQVKPKKVKEID